MSKSKNNYFHESEIRQLWDKHYKNNQPLTPQEEYTLWNQITRTINGVIFTHRQQRFGIDFDDIQAHALAAIHKALYNFNPDFITTKGKRATLFNFISLTAYRSIKYYTISQNKNRDLELSDVQIEGQYEFHYQDNEALKQLLYQIIKDSKHRSYVKEIFYRYADYTIEFIETEKQINRFRLHTFLKERTEESVHYRRKYIALLRLNKDSLLN